MSDENKCQEQGVKNPLPKTPLYQWFYDGRMTRKIIEWLSRINDGDLGDIDFDNPELQTLLMTIQGRIKALEDLVDALPNFQAYVERMNQLQTAIEKNQEAIRVNREEIDNTQFSIEEIQSELLEIRKLIDKNQGAITSNQTSIGSIQTDLSGAIGRIVALEEREPDDGTTPVDLSSILERLGKIETEQSVLKEKADALTIEQTALKELAEALKVVPITSEALTAILDDALGANGK